MSKNYQEIAKKYGTPLYLYDLSVLKNRVAYIKDKLDNKIGLVYAVKANSFLIKELSTLVERLEICSKGEYDITKSLNIGGDKMVISGVYKEEDDIREMLENNEIMRYTIESFNQYLLIHKLACELNKKVNVLLRLTSGNQFGMNEEEVDEIIRSTKEDELFKVCGIQYFSGTQKHSNKRNLKEITYIREFVDKLEKDLDFEIEEVEYGTGFPVFYFQEDFDEDAFMCEFNENLKILSDKKLYLEIGRSLVASCGEYLTKVVDIKRNKIGSFAIVDGGINHLVYYGQTMAMKVPNYEIIPKREGNEEIFNICGALCTINDIIVKQLPTNDLQLGDVFIFKNTGAYTSTEGIALFLSRDLPIVVMVDNDKEQVIRDRIKTSTINAPEYR